MSASACEDAKADTYHIGLKARLILSLEKLSPINVREEVMSFDLGSTIRTKPSLGVAVQQSGQKVLGRRRDDIQAGEMERFL